MKPRFKIGTLFKTRGKHPRVCIVTDIHTTRDSRGEIVKIRYVATHEFAGQTVTNSDVVDTTIAMGLIETKEHES